VVWEVGATEFMYDTCINVCQKETYVFEKETYIFEKGMIIKVEAEVVRECLTRDMIARVVWEVQHSGLIHVFKYVKRDVYI